MNTLRKSLAAVTAALGLGVAGLVGVPAPAHAAGAAITSMGTTSTPGGTLALSGSGWTHPSDGGSRIAVKIDEGAYSQTPEAAPVPGNLTVWAVIDADASGNFSATITLPAAISEGSHTLRLLTGSLKPGDLPRTLLSPAFTVTAAAPEPGQAVITSIDATGTPGGTLALSGSGWTHPSDGGSRIAVKIDDGAYSQTPEAAPVPGNLTVWAVIDANASGNFSTSITLPADISDGSHTLRLLTGSLKPGDTIRAVLSPAFTVGEPGTDPAGDGPVQAITPARLADTRVGTATVDGGALGAGVQAAGDTLRVPVRGRGGVPADAAGVVLNVTAADADGVGYVTVWSCDGAAPLASSLNIAPGGALPNAVVAGIGADGSVCLRVAEAGTHLIIDVNGFLPAGSPLTPLVPARLADTRAGAGTVDGAVGGTGAVAAGDVLEVPVRGRGGVAADAAVAILNVTATGAAGTGYVTVWSCDGAAPLASSVNFTADATTPNAVVATIGTAGAVCLSVAEAATELIVDVNAQLPDVPTLQTLVPARLLDTRDGAPTVDGQQAGIGARQPGPTLALPVTGRGGVPADATAVVLNVTVTGGEGTGYLTVWPCGTPRPTTSNLNYVADATSANAVLAKVGSNGTVCIGASEAAVHVLVDVTSAFVGAPA